MFTFLCNFLEEFEQDRCQLFSKFLVEFSCEAVWTWAFVCWKISDYSFNFCACDGSVKIFYFFLVQFWKVVLFRSEFSCEAVWTWAFVCWKISDYSFNFCACDGSVKIFYFFLVQFWKVVLF